MRKRFVPSMRTQGWHNSDMPLRSYLLSVGGALLALLFAADRLMPPSAANTLLDSRAVLPAIRIHSALKGPEAVVIDTKQPTILPMFAKHEGVATPQSRPFPESHAGNSYEEPIPPLLEQVDADGGRPAMSVETVPNIRDAFAQIVPGPPRHTDRSKSKRITPKPKRKRARTWIEKPRSLAYLRVSIPPQNGSIHRKVGETLVEAFKRAAHADKA